MCDRDGEFKVVYEDGDEECIHFTEIDDIVVREIHCNGSKVKLKNQQGTVVDYNPSVKKKVYKVKFNNGKSDWYTECEITDGRLMALTSHADPSLPKKGTEVFVEWHQGIYKQHIQSYNTDTNVATIKHHRTWTVPLKRIKMIADEYGCAPINDLSSRKYDFVEFEYSIDAIFAVVNSSFLAHLAADDLSTAAPTEELHREVTATLRIAAVTTLIDVIITCRWKDLLLAEEVFWGRAELEQNKDDSAYRIICKYHAENTLTS